MAAKPRVPNIVAPADRWKNSMNPNQPAAKIIDNAPAKTLDAALANSKKQVDATK
jgi:hypothetical protein